MVTYQASSVCFFVYLFLGAIIFHHLETENEDHVRVNTQDAKQRIRDDGCLTEEEVENLCGGCVRRCQVEDPSANVTNPSNWDYASAFFFSGTVVTTIGYGRSVPTTDLGRNICLLYALFGIPFTGWLLATVGNFYCDVFHKIAATIENFIHKHCQVKHRRLRKFTLYTVVFALSYSLIVLIPSSWFCIMEGWDFDIAHYYSFITLATIGFGDYVASVDSKHPRNQNLTWVYDIAIACWYVFGLSYLAVLITAIGKKQKQGLTKVRSSMKIHLGKDDKQPPIGFGLNQHYVETLQDEITEDGKNKMNGEVEMSVIDDHQVVLSERTYKHIMVRNEGTQTE
ncbi:LOW QUALITY PROTEIN: potassium channel, subfamily K, member 16-like [Amphiura filiformis]|uniref:LOW QUALITY PROTEIN: potassium channel, subfamily K, member 16-like n=1 Tax=Amphiura filiformis TaxID=82378 RepID=UPI003B2132B7